jgi:hypothetical protein
MLLATGLENLYKATATVSLIRANENLLKHAEDGLLLSLLLPRFFLFKLSLQ